MILVFTHASTSARAIHDRYNGLSARGKISAGMASINVNTSAQARREWPRKTGTSATTANPAPTISPKFRSCRVVFSLPAIVLVQFKFLSPVGVVGERFLFVF